MYRTGTWPLAAGAALATAALVVADRVMPATGVITLALLRIGLWATLGTGALRVVVWTLHGLGVVPRTLRRGPLVVSLTLLVVGVVSSAAVLVTAAPPVADESVGPQHELAHMHATDQADRRTLRAALVPERDARRLARVRELIEAGDVTTPEDHFHAAVVLQHGTAPAHYALAQHHASVAADAGVDHAAWLQRAAWDRWQASLGRPQRYGTQSPAAVEAVRPR